MKITSSVVEKIHNFCLVIYKNTFQLNLKDQKNVDKTIKYISYTEIKLNV